MLTASTLYDIIVDTVNSEGSIDVAMPREIVVTLADAKHDRCPGQAGHLRAFVAVVALSLASCAAVVGAGDPTTPRAAFTNAYPALGDDGARASGGYFVRRAWVQLTRNLDTTELPPTLPLALDDMAREDFAVAWLGHSSLLVRAGQHWLLTDPVFSEHAAPVPPFGPKRLTPLPIDPGRLPHIAAVLISHDHYDHLDLPTMRRLAAQAGGPPRFLVGRGLGSWFREQVNVDAEEFDWWDATLLSGLDLRFVPAQHSSGRSLWNKNRTLWGGWVVAHAKRAFYFAGDTAYSAPMFRDIARRAGPIDLAALPIGAYRPGKWMRFEHTDPSEALQAHRDLGARRSIAIHWATFQLGDEEPIEPARDLARARVDALDASFELLPVGGWVAIATEKILSSPVDRPALRASTP